MFVKVHMCTTAYTKPATNAIKIMCECCLPHHQHRTHYGRIHSIHTLRILQIAYEEKLKKNIRNWRSHTTPFTFHIFRPFTPLLFNRSRWPQSQQPFINGHVYCGTHSPLSVAIIGNSYEFLRSKSKLPLIQMSPLLDLISKSVIFL